MLKDVRYAVRTLMRAPLFVAAAVLSLALGIGANTAIFSLFDQVLLRSLPVRAPQELVVLHKEYQAPGWAMADNMLAVFSYPMYRDLRDRSTVFSGVIARSGTGVNFSTGGETERIDAELVSGNFFTVLGVPAALGRTLTPDDDRTPGAHPVAMLSHDFWVRRFGASPDVLNRRILLNGNPFTVIGVVPARFRGVLASASHDVFVPLSMKRQVTPVPGDFTDRSGRWINVLARRAPGISEERAIAATRTLYRAILTEELPGVRLRDQHAKDEFVGHKLDLLPARHGINHLREFWREPLIAIMVMVGLVLLIGCANVANLLLARAAGRRREIAIRMSVGAGRWAIVRQLMTESLLLAGAGGMVGLLIASWTTELLVHLLPDNGFGGWLQAGLDIRVLAFNIGVSTLTAILFGLAPAIQAARQDVLPGLGNRGTGGAARGQSRLRRALVVAQVALSLVLLAGAGLFARTLANLESVDPGFRAERLLKFGVAPMLSGYNPERSYQFFRDLRERLGGLHGVQAIGAANPGPFTSSDDAAGITVEGYRARPGEDPGASVHAITAGFFKTIGARVIAGRELTEADELSARKLVVVNEAFAKHYFGNENPLGRRVGFLSATPDREIAGVIRDLKHGGLRDEAKPTVFYPYTQGLRPTMLLWFFVRAERDEATVTAAIRRVVREMDVTVPVLGLQPITVVIEESLYTARLTAFLATAFGALALLLAALGLYGVVAYNVERRRPEIGIRMALGGMPSDVLRLVMGDVVRMVLFGVALGLPGAIAGARMVRSQLFGLAPEDPLVLVGSIAVLAAVAALSGLLPARRAARVDPMFALRYE